MEIEKNLKLTLLFDFYGVLLTEKQQQMFRMYYYDDISLGEIALINNISRQAVRDSLKKAEITLNSFETKLGMLSKYEQTKNLLEKNSSEISSSFYKKIMKIWEEN